MPLEQHPKEEGILCDPGCGDEGLSPDRGRQEDFGQARQWVSFWKLLLPIGQAMR